MGLGLGLGLAHTVGVAHSQTLGSESRPTQLGSESRPTQNPSPEGRGRGGVLRPWAFTTASDPGGTGFQPVALDFCTGLCDQVKPQTQVRFRAGS